MTELELKEIEARAEKATEGPWTVTNRIEGIGDKGGYEFMILVDNSHWASLTFVAHARTDVPALVAEVRALRTELINEKLRNKGPGQEAVERLVEAAKMWKNCPENNLREYLCLQEDFLDALKAFED